MAKKDEGAVGIVPGTVEYERQQFFEREKAEYERRTGETVTYVPPHPLTSTPLAGTPIDRSRQSVPVLKKEASSLGITLPKKAKKADIIAAIETQLAAAAEPASEETPSAEGEG